MIRKIQSILLILLLNLTTLHAFPRYEFDSILNAPGVSDAQKTSLDLKAPARLAVYYGWPSLVNEAQGDVNKAVATFSAFDIVVLGDGLEHPEHGDHVKTQEIIAQLTEVEVYGYVDMGVTTQNLSLETAQQYVDEWAAMGVTGIFWDDAGYDYGVDRQRQNALIDYTHAKGLKVFINAWNPDDVFADDPDMTHLNHGDSYLAESWLIGADNYQDLQHWQTKAEKLRQYHKQTAVQMLGLSTGPIEGDLNWPGHPYQMAWWGALLYDLNALGYTVTHYSSGGQYADHLIVPPQPDLTGLRFTSEQVNHQLDNSYHSRDTNQGEIGIGGDGSTWGLGYYRKTDNPLYTAIYYGNQGWAIEDLAALETWTGKKNSVVVLFTSFNEAFPTTQVENLWNNGNTPLITLEPQGYTAAQLAAGDADAIATQWAADFKAWLNQGENRSAFLRFGHEMNGNWYSWSGDPTHYVNAWQRLHAILSAQGCKWVWAVNNTDVNSPAAEQYYPGDDYVDWLAIDGYNWGKSQPNADWDTWLGFPQIFDNMLKRLVALSPNKPILIAEMGTSSVVSTNEVGQGISDAARKAQWLSHTYLLGAKTYPQIKLVAYFNEDKAGATTLISGESDWAIFNNGSQDNRWGIPEAEFDPNKRVQAYADAMDTDYYIYRFPFFGTYVAFNAASYTVSESDSFVSINVTRSGDGAVSVDYATTDDTAIADRDYLAASGTLSWSDDETTDKIFTVDIIDDGKVEGDETVILSLGNPTGGAELGEPDTAVLTITDSTPFNCKSVTEIPKKECKALIALYNSTDGENWIDNTGWHVTNMPCEWYGVRVNM
jgi:hypothetical protein